MPGQHPDIQVIPAVALDFLEQSRADCWALSKFMRQKKKTNDVKAVCTVITDDETLTSLGLSVLD